MKRANKDNVEAAKVGNIQSELNWSASIREIATGAGSSWPTDTVDVSSSAALPLDPLLITPVTTGASFDTTFLSSVQTTNAQNGDHAKAPQATTI